MVRATFAGYSTALSALQANQKRLDITGQNLANMNTPGYTRQQLQTSSLNYTNPISHYMSGNDRVVGFGVKMDKVVQIRDPYLDIQYRSQMVKSGYTDQMQASLDRLADIFDESSIKGFQDAFDDISATLINIADAGKVHDPIYEAELRARMQDLTNLFNDASRQIDEAERVEYSKLDGTGTSEQGMVQQVNDLLRQIGNLNREIKHSQIYGQEALELMDERNLLLDELSSYIPIEVTYYKDRNYDGKTDPEATQYEYDAKGNIIGKKDWPDDLRVDMVYQKPDGSTDRITLVEGTVGKGDDNYGYLQLQLAGAQTVGNSDGNLTADKDGQITNAGNLNLSDDTSDLAHIKLVFNGFTPSANGSGGEPNNTPKSVTFGAPYTIDANGSATKTGEANHFASDTTSIQASLDMLWKHGKTVDNIDTVRGYEYYRDEMDTLARAFANVMNAINEEGNQNAAGNNNNPRAILFAAKDGSATITAANIGISDAWTSGTIHIGSTFRDNKDANATILNMQEALKATYPYTNPFNKDLEDVLASVNPDLKNNSFVGYANHVSTILANDSYSNQAYLKTNMTVLNGIQNSRDSVSGVSLDEEASNMMMYMSAYSAASRLMTTLDQALDILINNTGVVGR